MTSNRPKWVWLIALLSVFTLLAAACGDDDSDDAGSGDDDADMTDGDDMAEGGLSACPNPIVIQTDWFPEPEHGALYNLTGGEGSVDSESGRFTGPYTGDPSIEIEIRAGGPYLGDQDTVSVLATDSDIFLGYVNTDEAIARYDDFPTTAVFAPFDINPQVLMWDPDTYDIETWEDVGETGAVINVFGGQYYVDWLIGSGLIDESQVDTSYDGSPARFIAEGGSLIQQGFGTQEPYNYENIFTEWGKPVDQLLIHDSGYEAYQGAVAILQSNLDDDARSCLDHLVPALQQSAIDYAADPAATNAAILQAVIDLDSFWVLDEAGISTAHGLMHGDLGIVGNGIDDTLGNFDLERVQGVIDLISENVPTIDVGEVTPEDIVTNDFIDESLGLS